MSDRVIGYTHCWHCGDEVPFRHREAEILRECADEFAALTDDRALFEFAQRLTHGRAIIGQCCVSDE